MGGFHATSGPYSWGASAGYGVSHVGLPTDAGYGAAVRGVRGPDAIGASAGAAGYGGYRHTEAVSENVYAARGTAVRNACAGTDVFGRSWYAAHPDVWNPSGWTAARTWSVATWPAIGSWYGWDNSVQPVYYNYGTSITYQGNQVYYGDQPVATADQYYQQASTLAQSQPPADPNAGEWMPLGVFGLVNGDQANPHYIIHLAVNRAGTLAGNYHDVITGTTLPVHGAVDKQSQRVAWTVGDNTTTVGETGIYNLTKDEAPVLIHIGKDKTQQWTLVRLKQPLQPDSQQ